MVSKRKWRGSSDKPGQRSKREDAANVFESFGKKAEEEKNPRKFDWAPMDKDTFVKGSEDEEIDEEMAFTEEDKKQFGEWFPPSKDEDEHDEDFEEMDELLTFDDDDEEPEMENEDMHEDQARALIESVAGGESHHNKKRKVDRVITEAVPESEFNIGRGAGKELTVGDLMSSLGKHRESLGASRWGLEKLTESTPLAVPMPRVIRERQERKVGYESAKQDLKKWQDIVMANRRAPTLEFAAPTLNMKSDKLGSLYDGLEPENDVEKDISALLRKAGAEASEDIEQSEDVLAMQGISPSQLKAKREQLRKMRSLLFYHEVKAKRAAAIKSKEYHRRLQRSIRKKAVKFSDLADDEAARKMAEEMEYKRAEERMTQRHSTKTRWARRIMRKGLDAQDEMTKEALVDHLRQAQELKKKMERMDAKDGTDSDTDASEPIMGDDSEDEGEAQPFKRARKAALDILEGKQVDEHTASKGLFSLPFMRKAMERRKQESMAQAEELLAEIDGTGQEKAEKSETTGRLTFSGNKTGVVPLVHSDSEEEVVLDPVATEAHATPETKTKRKDPDSQDVASRKIKPGQAKSVLRAIRKNDESEGVQEEENVSAGVDVPNGSVAAREFLFGGGIRESRSMGDNQSHQSVKNKAGATISPADGQGTNSHSVSGRECTTSEKKEESGAGRYVMITPQPNSSRNDSGSELEEISDADEALDAEPHANGENDKPCPPAKETFLMKPEGHKDKSQEDLIEMAFAGDDVGVDFAAEKAKVVEKDLGPEVEVNVLPGWGTWKSQQREPKWMREKRAKDKQEREQALAVRKDAKLEQVIINENVAAVSAKYMLDAVPRQFRGTGAYERSMAHPIGKDFNTNEIFQDLTRPSVIARAGVMINPLRYSDSLKEQTVETFTEYRPTDVKISRIVGGTIDSFVKSPQAEIARKRREERKGKGTNGKKNTQKKMQG